MVHLVFFLFLVVGNIVLDAFARRGQFFLLLLFRHVFDR